MTRKIYWLFPPLLIYNPAWTSRLPTGRQQVWSLYGLVILLALMGGLAGAAFAGYLPLRWLFMPILLVLTASGIYRLYNLVLSDFRQALIHTNWPYGLVLIGLIVCLSLLLAHLFALVIFRDVIRLAELRAESASFLTWQFIIDSRLLIANLTEPTIRLLWIWLQVVTMLLFTMPFLQLFFTRNNLHTHLYHVSQNLITRAQTPTTRS